MNIDFPTTPPATKKELFHRLHAVIDHKWYEIPDKKHYKGTGGVGNFLEDLVGARAGKNDIADSTGWEIKTYTAKTNLITLFHKEARPENIMRYMVRKWGWKDAKGRMSFRHTIAGKSDRFKVVDDGKQLIVRPLIKNGPVPHWTHEDLLNAASKLRRLLLVKAERKGTQVRFIEGQCFESLHFEELIYEMIKGTICVDFDAREAKPGSNGLRNHGTKFRVSPHDICRLYLKKDPFS